jgi:hypothetical protein
VLIKNRPAISVFFMVFIVNSSCFWSAGKAVAISPYQALLRRRARPAMAARAKTLSAKVCGSGTSLTV